MKKSQMAESAKIWIDEQTKQKNRAVLLNEYEICKDMYFNTYSESPFYPEIKDTYLYIKEQVAKLAI